jgi:hypothetical protein
VGIAIVVVSLMSISVSLTGALGPIGIGGSGLRVLLVALPSLAVVGIVVAAIRFGRGTSGYLYGVAAGLLYGVAALGTKGASTLVVRQGLLHSIPNILTSVYPYVFVLFSVLGMLIYQTGLQRSRISVVGSMTDVICSTYLVAIGMIIFDESIPRDITTLVLRLGGFAGVLLGSVLVAVGGREGSSTHIPPMESDLGMGSVLVAEVNSITGHSVDGLFGN